MCCGKMINARMRRQEERETRSQALNSKKKFFKRRAKKNGKL